MATISCQKTWTLTVNGVGPVFPPGPFNLDPTFLAAVQHYSPTASGIMVQPFANGYYEDSVVGNRVYINIYNPVAYFVIYVFVGGFLYAALSKDDLSATNPVGTYHYNPLLGLALGFGYPPGAATVS